MIGTTYNFSVFNLVDLGQVVYNILNLFIHSRNICSKTIKNAKSSFFQLINNKIASCQAGSRSFWSMDIVVHQNFYQTSFPRLKNNSDSSTTPASKAIIFAPVFASNSNLDDRVSNHSKSPLQDLLCHPLSSPHEKSAKPFYSSTPPKLEALMEF